MNKHVMQEERIRQGRILPRYAVMVMTRKEARDPRKWVVYDLEERKVLSSHDDITQAEHKAYLFNSGYTKYEDYLFSGEFDLEQ